MYQKYKTAISHSIFLNFVFISKWHRMGDQSRQSDQSNEWSLPHQIPNGPLNVKQIKKKQKNKTFVKKSNASHPADPLPNGYHHFNGMSLRSLPSHFNFKDLI